MFASFSLCNSKCFFKLWKKAKAEWKRLFGNLTEVSVTLHMNRDSQSAFLGIQYDYVLCRQEQKKVLEQFKTIAHECVKDQNESAEEFNIQDGEDFDMLGFDPVTFNDVVIECIRVSVFI